MKKSYFSLGSILGGIVALMFSGVALYGILVWGRLQKYATFPASISFAAVNLLLVVLAAFFGKALAQAIGTPGYIFLVFITAIYTLFLFVHMSFFYSVLNEPDYVMFHLIVLLAYFMFAAVIIATSVKRNHHS